MQKLFNYDLVKLLTDPAAHAILQKGKYVEMPEGAIIISPGQFQQNLYFIKKGIVRSYYQSLGVEWTKWFSAEGSPVFSTESFLNDCPSSEYIETCTPVILYQISKKDYDLLMKEIPELYALAFQFLRNYLEITERRIHESRMLTAYQQYEQFIETHKPIVNRVQMKHIASYMGITPTHLSRVRKEFAKKNRQVSKPNDD